MAFEEALSRLEAVLAQVDELEDEARQVTFELLDGVDTIHRFALRRLAEALGEGHVGRLTEADPAVAWLFEAYGIGIDEPAAADAALDQVRPYIESHGGSVEVLEARDGVVRLRMSGACAGCTASAVTLQDSIEEALREHMPGFLRVEAEEDEAEPHPPPVGFVPIELGAKPEPGAAPAAGGHGHGHGHGPGAVDGDGTFWKALDASPPGDRFRLVRDELGHWVQAEDDARRQLAARWNAGLAARPATAEDLAESFLATVVEVPPANMSAVLRSTVEALGDLPDDERERLVAFYSRALAHFPVPQMARLRHVLGSITAEAGLPELAW